MLACGRKRTFRQAVQDSGGIAAFREPFSPLPLKAGAYLFSGVKVYNLVRTSYMYVPLVIFGSSHPSIVVKQI